MPDVTGGPWWVIAAASAPSIASGAWVVWRWWVERKDKSDAAELSSEERQMVLLQKARESLDASQQSLFGTLSVENERLRGELVITRKDRDRGWALFRRMEERALQLLHRLLNAQTDANAARTRAGVPTQKWPVELPLPTDQEASA